MPYKDRAKQREYRRAWIASRRAKFFADKQCAACGSTDQLELDHVEPERKVSHRIWSWSVERREEELKKCQVLCHDCHSNKTKRDNRWQLVHGTVTGYHSYGCRCRECVIAHTTASNEYRWRTGRRQQRVQELSPAA